VRRSAAVTRRISGTKVSLSRHEPASSKRARVEAREKTESSCRTKSASIWFLARSSSSAGTGSLLTSSISSMMARSSSSGVRPGSGVPENQKIFGSWER
jgi:hypothetical protein